MLLRVYKTHTNWARLRPFSTSTSPIRVCVVGAGPAGYYTIADLLRSERNMTIDILEKLPTPFGLVRSGVAPDHPEVKHVEHRFRELSEDPRVRFYGNVTVGEDITVEALRKHYPIIVFASGAEFNRPLPIPGHQLPGVHYATDFVGWYNSHPHYQNHSYDMSSAKSVVIIGNGNVAVDIARILAKDPEELKETDISSKTLQTLKNSSIKDIYVVGRRGPAQAAFTTAELREFLSLQHTQIMIDPDTYVIQGACLEELKDRVGKRKHAVMDKIAAQTASIDPTKKVVRLHFLHSPVQFNADPTTGRLASVTFQHNKLVGSAHNQKAVPDGTSPITIPADMVFIATGSIAKPTAGLPFDSENNRVPSEDGRVVTSEKEAFQGVYASGWIKRGATGVIATNIPDAEETTAAIYSDLDGGKVVPFDNNPPDIPALLKSQGKYVVSWADWLKIDEHETKEGARQGKLREKQHEVRSMLALLE